MPGMFLMVLAAPASATGLHSSPVFGRTFQFVRSGKPIIFAICGLTVLGTGTECAGTSSTGAFAIWALPACELSIAATPQNNAAVDLHITRLRISLAGALMAFPLFQCFFVKNKIRAPRAPLQSHCFGNIPPGRQQTRTDL